jgi:hypothetical protein
MGTRLRGGREELRSRVSNFAEDLLMLREPVRLFLGEDKIVIHDHFEYAALPLDQLSLYPSLF